MIKVCYEGSIVTRKEAVLGGYKRYFTGGECKNGHIAERYVNSGRCCECNIQSTVAWREDSKSKGSCKVYPYKELPSVEYLESLLSYNPYTGIILWKERPVTDFKNARSCKAWHTRYKGKEAEAIHYANGYREIRLPDGRLYKTQRLAWKLHYREEPKSIIDHINGIPSDNRVVNLREATHQDNTRNSKNTGNSSMKGVSKDGSGYKVQWCIGDNNFYEKGFTSEECAAKRYDEIVKDLYGEFARTNYPTETKEESI